ncbi:MAG TPA: response regulator [Polyangiaceae bacterium]|nr:response regulator [Polyangiaceae bacterium]
MRVDPNPLSKAFVPARLLLAEDDAELRALLATSLREDGFEVVEVADGNALVDRLADAMAADGSLDGFDLVVSDIRMPGFSALEVMIGMRRMLFRTPVVLITAFGDPKTHERAKRLGASLVIDKPFDVDELRSAVTKLVGQHWRRE